MLITPFFSKQTGNAITGTVTAKEDQALFFSLPYDKGWTVYVDGSPVETFPIATDETVEIDEDGNEIVTGTDDGALLGAHIHAGTHTVTAVYTAPGQTLGLLVSIAAALLLLIPAYRRWFRRRRTIVVAVKTDNSVPETETAAETPAETAKTPTEEA